MTVYCNAKAKSHPDRFCRRAVVPGKTKCRYHGGLSTGPRSTEGLHRTLTAAYLGKKKWFEQRRAAGLPLPGRPKGSKSRTTIRYEQAMRVYDEELRTFEQRQEACTILRQGAVAQAEREAMRKVDLDPAKLQDYVELLAKPPLTKTVRELGQSIRLAEKLSFVEQEKARAAALYPPLSEPKPPSRDEFKPIARYRTKPIFRPSLVVGPLAGPPAPPPTPTPAVEPAPAPSTPTPRPPQRYTKGDDWLADSWNRTRSYASYGCIGWRSR